MVYLGDKINLSFDYVCFIPASCGTWGPARSLLHGPVTSNWSTDLSQEHRVHSDDVT